METGGDGVPAADDSGGPNCNFTNNAWDIWDISTPAGTRYDSTNSASDRGTDVGEVHALLYGAFHHAGVQSNSLHHRMPDPHMMCLKLGKRHYCEDTVVPDRHVTAESSTTVKRGKPQYLYYATDTTPATTSTTTVWPKVLVPRCQVEGCRVSLGNAKEYYRKHKVCEIHSKAPKVVVLGLQQRFCQQCSRFHGVTEFDEAKRSCRRRLKGHNQRRRKRTLSNNSITERRLGPFPPSLSSPGCALSLLSSPETEPWNFSGDLSSRCSAALYELIAANRATGHFLNQNSYDHQSLADNTFPDTQMRDRFGHTTPTPDLTPSPALEFGRLSVKEPEEWADYCWSTFGGDNVV